MNQIADFFQEFAPVSKTEWLAKITKDLKGKPLDDLYWHLNADLTIDPFGHADDFPIPPAPLQEAVETWEINEDINDPDPGTANRQALEALTFGAESLHIQLAGPDYASTLGTMLEGVHLDYVSLHFGGTGLVAGPAAVLATLGQLARERQILPENLRGSLFYDPAAAPGDIQDWRYMAELMQYARTEFPGFRCVTLDGHPDFQGTANATEELAGLLRKGHLYLKKGTERGMSAAQVASQMQFSLYVGKSYFVEIAKLRAFKILWANVLKGWGVAPAYPVLDVRFAPDTYTDDLYTNMIRATTMAMSAVLGGAGRLTVLPYDAGREDQAKYPRAFAHRIARNVQHLLRLESGFGEIADPAAGSYYIEKLTAQLASAAWEKFQKNR